MSKELIKKGYEVEVYTKYKGRIAEKFKCPVKLNLEGEYDIAIVNHTTCWSDIDAKYPKIHKIFTSHSKFVDIEQPPVSNYVGVNEFIGGEIIRNGIDCERFKPTTVNSKPLNILYLSNPAYSKGKEIVRQQLKGYNLIFIEEQLFEIEKLIDKADIVISMARGALESMACGKNVIYGDWREGWLNGFKGIGMITEENFDYFKSGKAIGELKTLNLAEEVKKYDPKRGEWLRERILDEFNIEKTAKAYIDYAKRHFSNELSET